MTGNKVFVNDEGLIEIIVHGNQTVTSVQTMGDQASALAAQYRAQGQAVLILDNLLQMGEVPPEARRRVVELGKTIDYDKLAMVGSGGILRLGANLMLQAVGKGRTIKYFDTYTAAIHWLKS